MTTQVQGSRLDGRTAELHLPKTDGWTPAHSEAARFVGECFAVGAVLGFVTELARPVWEKRGT
jgi:hypothetical protein